MLSDHRRIAVLGLVVVTVLALAVSWWTQPTALPGDAERVAQRAAVDSTVDVVVVPSVPPGLTLRSVEPDLPAGTTRADVQVLLCGRLDGDASVEVSTAGDLTAICSTARPAKAGTRTRPDESLLVRVTPRARGDVELRGLRVRYTRDARHLWQTGTQLVPVAVRVITP
ncbi:MULTISPECIES: hypothetical protein [Aeromicrobium]|uniref:Uncharacterized protein n=1 Tax=Aeromicrobium erythreum TaxID=2041 RepID=A0A0U4BDH2_9ACTN|nr:MULTISPECIES: hypothetical protein [Aeromicrobium]ALX05865.1 hypothetical protein AERYTH_14740 [Aeromicrobium erythreum]